LKKKKIDVNTTGETKMETDLDLIEARAKIELMKLESQQSAKEVAGKAIGKQGLFYITLIVVIGVIASIYLEADKIAAVMGLLGASLTALISMLNGIAGSQIKEDKPEFQVMTQLIDRLDGMVDRDPMSVEVDDKRVTVSKGNDKFTSQK
jgi:hypothetical protein